MSSPGAKALTTGPLMAWHFVSFAIGLLIKDS